MLMLGVQLPRQKRLSIPLGSFITLKMMYYKIEAIKIKMPLEKIYNRLNGSETLTDIFKEITTDSKAYLDEVDPNILIPEEFISRESEYSFDL